MIIYYTSSGPSLVDSLYPDNLKKVESGYKISDHTNEVVTKTKLNEISYPTDANQRVENFDNEKVQPEELNKNKKSTIDSKKKNYIQRI